MATLQVLTGLSWVARLALADAARGALLLPDWLRAPSTRGSRSRLPACAPRLRASRPGSSARTVGIVIATGGLTFGILRFLG